jgi:surface carbohydrate biosynthesis protein
MVLIYDAAEGYALLEYLHPWRPEVLHTRGEELNIPVLAASFFRRGPFADAYIDGYIRAVSPRLVVTFTDNDSRFYFLAKRNSGIRTLFVQNGLRGYVGEVFENFHRLPILRGLRRVDLMAVFGNRIGAEYGNHIEGEVVSIGSIKNNWAARQCRGNSGTIAFISQFRTDAEVRCGRMIWTRQQFFENPDRLVLEFLLEYSQANSKRLIIVPCSGFRCPEDLPAERDYYVKLLGKREWVFAEGNTWRSCYDNVDAAEVVVSIDSTLGYEAAARGNKTAVFSIRSNLLAVAGRTFGWPGKYPDDGPFWTNRPDAEVFKRILDHLFRCDANQWRAELEACNYSEIMNYDPQNSALRSILLKELGLPAELPQ